MEWIEIMEDDERLKKERTCEYKWKLIKSLELWLLSLHLWQKMSVTENISLHLFFAYCHFYEEKSKAKHIVEEREYFELLAVARSWIREI